MIDNYNDLSIDMFYDVKDILESDLELLEKEEALVALLDGKSHDEVLDMSIKTFGDKVKQLQFLTTVPKNKAPETKYVIDGMEFKVILNPEDMNVAQYIDFNEYQQLEDEKERTVGLLSVFMIPSGKKYGEYDIREVKGKIRKMGTSDVLGLSAFFLEWSRALTKTIHTFLIKKLRKMVKKERNNKTKMELMEALIRLEGTGDMLP